MKKLNGIVLLSFVLMGTLIMVTSSCKKDDPPALGALKVFKVTDNSACCCAECNDDGGAAVTERGVCWCTSSSPTTGNNKTSSGMGTGEYECELYGLSPNTTYYVRAYAINDEGTNYGDEVTFTTPPTVTDIDGNTYHTVVIGDQVWMTENLKVTHYRNGEAIPMVQSGWEWGVQTAGAYFEFNLNYGLIYNGYAALDSRNLAPAGWHIPSDAEWKILEGTVDSVYKVGDPEWDKTWTRGSDVGGKLKEDNPIFWDSPNVGATNESGFTAMPAGYRHWDSGVMFDFRGGAYYPTSTSYDDLNMWVRCISNAHTQVYRTYNSKQGGGSVRCIKD